MLSAINENIEKEKKRLVVVNNKEEVNYYSSLVQLIRVSIILDLGIKLSLTQCTPPNYGSVLETVLKKFHGSVDLESFEDLLELKHFCIEYGLIEEYNYDGSQAKTEELLKMLQVIENLVVSYEKSILESSDESLPFLTIMSLRKHAPMIMLIRPSQIEKSLRESVLLELNYMIIRLLNLISFIDFKTDSNICIMYMTQYRLLAKKKFEKSRLFEILPSHDFSQISTHLMHQKTRRWLLGKIETWLVNTNKPFYYVAGLEGTGKSCLVSAFCKLYDSYIVDLFVFDSRYPCGVCQLIKSIANSLMHQVPEYLCTMNGLIPETSPPPCSPDAGWQELYNFLLKKPLYMMYGDQRTETRRKLVVIDALNECIKSEWDHLVRFMDCFRKDFGKWFCMLVTCRTENLELMPYACERRSEKFFNAEGVDLDSKTWNGLHLTDLEMFFSSCFCDIISRRVTAKELNQGDNFRGFSKCLDNFLKHTAGKFSYAQHLLRLFDEAMMESGGQLQKSVIDCFEKFTSQIGRDKMDEELKNFAKIFYTYRLKEGNPGSTISNYLQLKLIESY